MSSSIHPAAWGCFPSPSVLSRPGLSPSWSECVSSASLPWFVEIPPSPHCQTPWLSASAPACASPLSPACEAAANKNFMSTADHGSEFMYSTYIMVNIIAVALYPHRSSSCLRALLWALRALSSACLFCSSASTSSSESPPGPGRSSESSSPWATSSSLIRASRERVWGTLEGEKKVIRYVVQNVPISQLIYHTVRCVSATGVWRWLPRCQENWSLCLSLISRHRVSTVAFL